MILFLVLCCETIWCQTDSINNLRRKAIVGDIDAMVELGRAYWQGKYGVDVNYDTAMNWFRQAADRGNAYGMNGIGILYQDGLGVDTNYALAKYWFQRSANMGNPKAQANLAIMYHDGLGMDKNTKEAERLAKLSANQDDVWGIFVLGLIYYYDSLITNDREAFNLFKRAVEKGDEASAYYLGLCYDEGIGVKPDKDMAVDWYLKSAKYGEPLAQRALGDKYFNGYGLTTHKTGVHLRRDLAVYWYRKAAEQGDVYSQKRLAYCYKKGEGNLKKCYDSAFYWYHKVALQGDWGSQYEIAEMYENGLGVERNIDSACYWYYKSMLNSNNKSWDILGSLTHLAEMKRAERDSVRTLDYLKKANAGDVDAMCELGQYYSKIDSLEAFYWYKRAAELGSIDALNHLVLAYEAGKGVKKDSIEAERMLLQLVNNVKRHGINSSHDKSVYKEACIKIGNYYRYGTGHPSDDEKAVQWYTEAIDWHGYDSLVVMAENGISLAKNALIKINRKAALGDTLALTVVGKYQIEKCNIEEGLKMLEKAWEKGCLSSAGVVESHFYWQGELQCDNYIDSLLHLGLSKESVDSMLLGIYVQWMERYTKKITPDVDGYLGYNLSHIELSWCYHEKYNDQYQSVCHLLESAKATTGSYNTFLDLVSSYIYGIDCLEQDFEKAIIYYQKKYGEKLGRALSERVIGDYYEEMGDTLTAYCWYQSALTGYANGKTKDIEKEFNPSDAKEIKKLYDKIRYIKDHFTLPTEDLRRRRSSFPPKFVSPSTSKSTKITWFNWPEHPKDEIIYEKSFLVNALIESDNKILDYNITVNGKVVEAPATRGQKLSGQSSYERRLYTKVPVEPGMNILSINVVAEDGQAHSIKTITYKSLEKKQYVNGNKERRLALVIGNAKYPKDNSRFGPLSTTINDAKAIADQLEKLGFRVMRAFDVDIMSMWDSISLFGEMAPHYDVGLFYYAGHGVSLNGDNYLIPIRSECRDTVGLRNEAVPLNKVIEKMDDFSLKIIMLDACRDYFIQSRGIMERGLSDISPEGTLISFAASPGKTASEGKEHSPYTEAVLKMLKKGDVALLEFFSEVHDEVLSKTGQMQEPVWHSAVNKEGRKFCFNKR